MSLCGKQSYVGSNRQQDFHSPISGSCVLSCKNGHREVHTNRTERQSILVNAVFYNQNATAEHSSKSQFNICNSDSCEFIWAWKQEQLRGKTGVLTSTLKCGIWSGKKGQSLLKKMY